MTKRVLVSIVLALVACGGKSTPATPKQEDVAPPPDMAFKDMNADQRMAFMKLVVVPTMKPMFQQFDPKEFAEFNCKTCHGRGAEDGSFEMPSPDIDRLPKPENFQAFAQEPEHAPWVKFMAEQVKPEMAKLLKKTEYNPQTNTGEFSCGACHMTEGEEPKQ